MQERAHTAAAITARLDRLPPTRHIWTLVVLLSVGGCFELYDLLMTAYVSPGLIRSGVFHAGSKGLFGLTDQAAFASITFAGLFVATIGLGHVADRYGRRVIFTWSLLWYSAATLVMATRQTALGVDLWRFIAALGVGVELVTIDTYLAELVPKRLRGRAFIVNQSIQFCSMPLAALMGWIFAPIDPFGIAGWRFVAAFPALAAIAVWFIRRAVPESPRWLAQQGRGAEADRIAAAIEAKVAAEARTVLPPPEPAPAEEERSGGTLAEIWVPPYRRRTIMLIVFNLCQSIGYYGFNNWVPALLAAQGATFNRSLEYSFMIALASPTLPLLFYRWTDRTERKWQLVAAACGIGSFGALFTLSAAPAWLVFCGIGITTASNLMSYAFHAYQPELFPTRVRARAVGFVYSFSRLSTVFSSFMIAFFLAHFGTPGVFAFIGAAMLVVVVAIGAFGPRTRGLALEEISQ
ncbi:MAG: MFS transporter [Rhodospirillales bacterium]|nr:MFS transporter [Rhodospirillales bacterium]